MSAQINGSFHPSATMTTGSLTSDEHRSMSPNHQTSYEGEKYGYPHETLTTQAIELESAVSTLSFPEGGARAWLTVLGGSIISFCTFGVVQSFGVYQDYYTRIALNEHTPSEISWIGSVQVFCLFAFGLPAGKLFELGYFHHLLISGSLLYLFSTFMLSLAQPHHYYQFFLAQSVGAGIGMGLMFIPSLSVSAHYFRKRRSLAMGMVIVGSSLGGCIYPIMLNNVFETVGFSWGVRAVGFMDLGLLIIANSVVRTRLPPNKGRSSNSLVVKEILTDTAYIVYMAGTFLVFWGVFVPFFYLQLWSSLHHINPTFTKYSITIMNATSIAGRVLPNLIADKYGPLNTIIVLSFITGALVFVMFGATTIGGIAAFGIFYGFFSGGTVSLATPAVSSFVTRSDASDLPLRIAILSFTLAFPLLTGNPLAGALLAPPRLLWSRPIVLAAVFLLGGSGCYMLAWRLLRKRKDTMRV
ncbi:MFS general substrate transporter [Macrolepiota fuliginosa MF-IS2]|uniref:MFS general substrate transporter n=1 Tax=Macrolepiota fuliginosa MF-IS2 TaxID=1400762 RepID=A0A9P6C780_9AGAR|nr:MFS general substrate transporter [Macrolepiota fuliginosa MF-IS2]